uniref:TSA: Wollemia nobilis Ref_Wollemi_Transcript_3279_734 transcribed RNA sequence n=1 Tax=Wollemia nobilis TaxID=56998 RepID=A0A0C9RQ77_9CONI
MSMPMSFGTGATRAQIRHAPHSAYFRPRKRPALATAKIRRPVEELYNIACERNVTDDRLNQLGVQRWSRWESGKCKLYWEWQVDQQVYIVKGSVRVVPKGSENEAWFYAGDLVRYPKWFEASLYFQGPYEERYRFLAYGDE